MAQENVVPNGGFEDTLYCPNGPGEIIASVGWINPCQFPCIMSPDYYNECNSIYYFVNANNGNAYAGFFVYDSINFALHPREYLQTRLKNTLEKDRKYCIEAYFRLSDYCNYATKNIGFLFSNSPIFSITYNLCSYEPQVEFNSFFLSERNEWVKVFGNFIAEGNEDYITIGNFRDNYETEILYTYASIGAAYSYYYIDDVSVYLCEDTLSPTDTFYLYMPNVFTPNADGKNDTWQVKASGVQQLYAAVYNRWGSLLWQQEVFADSAQNELNLSWDGRSSTGMPASAGTYYYLVTCTTKEGEIKKEKGFLTLTN